ncbi:putative Formate dehydrogenase delta subunit [Novosphingobium sp. KN65.2]|nr:putative Formate dehydrogenase delta subunit [Novosphingobium sp. KN65.2]
MMNTREHLIYMAGQIFRNFASSGEEAAVSATAEHLVLYWDPHMKAQALDMLDDPEIDLPEPVRAVFGKLRVAA